MSYLIFNIGLFLLIGLSILALYLIYKVEDLENELEEKQSLINSSRRSLADAEQRITQRNKVIEYQEDKSKKLNHKLTVLEAFINSNDYGNPTLRLQKLKELVRPGNQN